MIKDLFISCLLLYSIVLVGCKQKENNRADTNVPGKAVKQTKTQVVPKDAVAVVNGTIIPRQQLDKNISAEIAKVKNQMPEPFLTKYKQELQKKMLDDIVTQIILNEKIAENKIVVTDKEIDDRMAELYKQNEQTMESFLDLLKAKGETLTGYRENLRKDLAYRKLMELHFRGKINLTEEEITDYYAQHKADFVRSAKTGDANSNKKEPTQLTMEEAKQDIIKELIKQKQLKLAARYVMALKNQANIVYASQ